MTTEPCVREIVKDSRDRFDDLVTVLINDVRSKAELKDIEMVLEQVNYEFNRWKNNSQELIWAIRRIKATETS